MPARCAPESDVGDAVVVEEVDEVGGRAWAEDAAVAAHHRPEGVVQLKGPRPLGPGP